MGSLQAKPIDNLTQEEIKELEDTFNLFDDDGSGTISAEELGQVRQPPLNLTQCGCSVGSIVGKPL